MDDTLATLDDSKRQRVQTIEVHCIVAHCIVCTLQLAGCTHEIEGRLMLYLASCMLHWSFPSV